MAHLSFTLAGIGAVAVGDRVRYSRGFLRNVGLHASNLPGVHTWGRVEAVRPLGSSITLAVVRWEQDGSEQRVNVKNLVREGKRELDGLGAFPSQADLDDLYLRAWTRVTSGRYPWFRRTVGAGPRARHYAIAPERAGSGTWRLDVFDVVGWVAFTPTQYGSAAAAAQDFARLVPEAGVGGTAGLAGLDGAFTTPRGERIVLDETYRLPWNDGDRLMQLWVVANYHPGRVGAALFPWKPSGYSRAAGLLGSLASNRAAYLIAKRIGTGNPAAYMNIVRTLYAQLPEYARVVVGRNP